MRRAAGRTRRTRRAAECAVPRHTPGLGAGYAPPSRPLELAVVSGTAINPNPGRPRAASRGASVLSVRCHAVGESPNRCSTRRSACSGRREAVSGTERGNGLLELFADVVETLRF